MNTLVGICAFASLNSWIKGAPMRPWFWWEYLGAAVIYTLMVFIGVPRRGSQVLSPQNTRTRSTIFAVHGAFLAVFLGAIWIVCRSLALLPPWLTVKGFISPGRFGGYKVSLIELLFVALLVVLRTIEMPCVYVESKTPRAGTFESPSAPKWMDS